MVTITTANGFSWGSPTGRTAIWCASAPTPKPPTIPAITASGRGTPRSQTVHTMNVENIAISPWAKLSRPVDR